MLFPLTVFHSTCTSKCRDANCGNFVDLPVQAIASVCHQYQLDKCLADESFRCVEALAEKLSNSMHGCVSACCVVASYPCVCPDLGCLLHYMYLFLLEIIWSRNTMLSTLLYKGPCYIKIKPISSQCPWSPYTCMPFFASGKIAVQWVSVSFSDNFHCDILQVPHEDGLCMLHFKRCSICWLSRVRSCSSLPMLLCFNRRVLWAAGSGPRWQYLQRTGESHVWSFSAEPADLCHGQMLQMLSFYHSFLHLFSHRQIDAFLKCVCCSEYFASICVLLCPKPFFGYPLPGCYIHICQKFVNKYPWFVVQMINLEWVLPSCQDETISIAFLVLVITGAAVCGVLQVHSWAQVWWSPSWKVEVWWSGIHYLAAYQGVFSLDK